MGVKRTQTVKYTQNAKGEKGAVMRGPQAWGDCATGYAFQAGSEGEEWKDVVLYNGNYYSCTKQHIKTATNYPGSAADQAGGFWQLGDNIELVATKILMSAYALVENLGVQTIDMRDADGNILFQAKDGAVTCKTGNFENVTIDGTLSGVTGSFKALNCVNDDGDVICSMSFNEDGMSFNNGDTFHQGTKDGRSLRFRTSDLWCRGQFGAAERNVLVVYGSYGYYHTNGVDNAGTYIAFTAATDSNGNTYYTIPCYGTSSNSESAGFPVDTVVFRGTSATYRYLLSMFESQRILLLNAYDKAPSNSVLIYVNGSSVALDGGQVREVIKLHTFQYPQQASSVLGAGLFLGKMYDNNWAE